MTSTESITRIGWTADDSTFGARLALIRQRMQWGNVKEAALECGLPPESWRTWERDGVEPRRLVDVAVQISDRVGCDLGWLIAGPRLHTAEPSTTHGLRRNTHQFSGDRPSSYPTGRTRPGVPRRPARISGPLTS
jgi:hypothetical protein